jgi:nitroimidazol reductase NimA-like FMN-containing flavoprotein (pyridoxamine 5'-phosphate oxidase superfamily)
MLTRMFTTAVSNARQALIDVAGSNIDRCELEPLADTSGDPGRLHRLSRDECLRLLASRSIGRYAHVENAHALAVVPVNYLVRANGAVLFRTGPGPKLSAADRQDVVAFQVDDIDETHHTGWSVLVTGRASRLSHAEMLALEDIPQPWANGPRHQVVLIEPTHIEGRRLT